MDKETKKKSVRVEDFKKTGDTKMTIAEAAEKWNAKFPEARVTQQTLRNWMMKFKLGNKRSFLPRSHWEVDEERFYEFLSDPRKFLLYKKTMTGRK